jgi:hypothetical protein
MENPKYVTRPLRLLVSPKNDWETLSVATKVIICDPPKSEIAKKISDSGDFLLIGDR